MPRHLPGEEGHSGDLLSAQQRRVGSTDAVDTHRHPLCRRPTFQKSVPICNSQASGSGSFPQAFVQETVAPEAVPPDVTLPMRGTGVAAAAVSQLKAGRAASAAEPPEPPRVRACARQFICRSDPYQMPNGCPVKADVTSAPTLPTRQCYTTTPLAELWFASERK